MGNSTRQISATITNVDLGRDCCFCRDDSGEEYYTHRKMVWPWAQPLENLREGMRVIIREAEGTDKGRRAFILKRADDER
jgi:hypothetical protein